MPFFYTDAPQIEDLTEFWTSEAIDEFLESQDPQWDDDWDDQWDTTAPLIPFYP